METFTMSRKEVPRAGLVRAALAGKITNAEGAGALHLTVRQFKRLKARVRTEGVAGLPHRARGRPGRRHLGADLREQVVTLMTTVYDGFNDVHLTEKLRERHAQSDLCALISPPSPRAGVLTDPQALVLLGEVDVAAGVDQHVLALHDQLLGQGSVSPRGIGGNEVSDLARQARVSDID